MTGTQMINTNDQVSLSVISVMLVMGFPVNFIDFNLAEVSAFNFEDLAEEFFFGVHVVPIVLAAKNLE